MQRKALGRCLSTWHVVAVEVCVQSARHSVLYHHGTVQADGSSCQFDDWGFSVVDPSDVKTHAFATGCASMRAFSRAAGAAGRATPTPRARRRPLAGGHCPGGAAGRAARGAGRKRVGGGGLQRARHAGGGGSGAGGRARAGTGEREGGGVRAVCSRSPKFLRARRLRRQRRAARALPAHHGRCEQRPRPGSAAPPQPPRAHAHANDLTTIWSKSGWLGLRAASAAARLNFRLVTGQ